MDTFVSDLIPLFRDIDDAIDDLDNIGICLY